MRSSPIWIGTALALALVFGCSRPQPDVVLISIDTLRADALGCYGRRASSAPHPSPSPHIDRLAAESIRFSNAVTPVPVTLPAHASLFTALGPRRHGLRNNGMSGLPAPVVTAAQWFGRHGYRTAGFPSAAVLERRYGLDRGFERFDDGWLAAADAAFEIHERSGAAALESAWSWWRAAAGRPRFLWLHLFEPHAPYRPPPPWAERFGAEPYLGEVAASDAVVGALLERVRQEARPPIVALVADHGESLGEHGEATHGTLLYESTLRIPLLIRAPGLAPRVDSSLATLVDVLPTLCALAGLPAPARIDGLDLLAAAPPERSIDCESYLPELDYGWKPLLAVRQWRFKLIAAAAPELYDLQTDPHERSDLAARKPALRRRLERRLPEQEGVFATAAAGAEQRNRLLALGYAGGAERAARADAPDPHRFVRLLAHLDRAAAALEREEPQRAEAELLELLGADPGNRAGLKMLTRVFLDQGRLVEAELLLRRAIEAGDRSAGLLTRWGNVLQDLGETRAAEAALEEAVARGPEQLEARIALGTALAQNGELERAEQQLRAAARLAPNHAVVLANLAGVLDHRGRHAEAEALYRRVLRQGGTRFSAWIGLGNSLRQQGRLEEALAAYEQAVESAPQQPIAWYNLGRLHDQLGRLEGARLAYRRFLELAPGPAWAEVRAEIERRLAEIDGGGPPTN